MASIRAKRNGKYPIPNYTPAQKHQSEKGEDSMYPFNSLGFNMNEVQGRNDDILSKLSLFAPYNHEDDIQQQVASTAPSAHVKDSPSKEVLVERPVTPINDEIRSPPVTFQRLAKLVRRRIVPQPDVRHLVLDDQKELGAIVMGEVNGIWADLKMQVDDPFLSTEENSELQRRLTVHIVTVCEQLFLHYLQKAQILNSRGVFSGPANMSRLKAQLALDANKFLNILTIRRYIVADLKSERNDGGTESDNGRTKPGLPQQQYPLLSYQGLIEASRPKTRGERRRAGSTEEDLAEIEESVPVLDTSKLMAILTDLPTDGRYSRGPDAYTRPKKAVSKKEKAPPRVTSADISRDKLMMRKSTSAPTLVRVGDSLRDELGLPPRTDSARSLGDIQEEGPSAATQGAQLTQGTKEFPKPAPGSWEYRQEDLRRLAARDTDGKTDATTDAARQTDDGDDLPPLLQAVTGSERQEARRREIQERLQELEARERARRVEERIEIQEPTHPQPATVATKLPNKMVVRTSDVRVSDRVCLSSVTLGKHSTVYNDLIDEIDPLMVKHLDRNLFLGDEITEVYTEIMKTVPTDHLQLENDELIEPAADALNLSNILASSTLHKRPADRIINPQLHRRDDPPWGEQGPDDWAKTPFSPPTDLKGRPLINPMVPTGEGLANKDFYGSGAPAPPHGPPAGLPEDMPEVMARSYASWLTWWKNTINSDDYMKYLSTQESDYMGAVFHFYNSDDEDEDDDPNSASRMTKKSRQLQQEERQRKLEEVKAVKTAYSDGFWNANAVLLGGLGNDPTVDEDAPALAPQTPTTEAGTSHAGKNRSLVVSRNTQHKSALSDAAASSDKRSKTREGQASRLSQAETRATGTASQKRSGQDADDDDAESRAPTAQDRLEKVWAALRMTDGDKLDMAIKYSGDGYHQRLGEAMESWEEVTELILLRESFLAKLEDFERLASDPNRFFEKGQRGSSVARLDEAKMRSYYYKKIESVQEQLVVLLDHLKREYQDTVTYQGRPYADKMQWDRTEMLYWLQEERKQQAMEYEARMRATVTPRPLKVTQGEPLTARASVMTAVK